MIFVINNNMEKEYPIAVNLNPSCICTERKIPMYPFVNCMSKCLFLID